MVEKSSATNGNLTRNLDITFGFNTTHSDLVKFESFDERSNTTITQLSRMVNLAMKRVADGTFPRRDEPEMRYTNRSRVGTY